ncbi:MAG: hypothetical protein KAZ63_05880 [Vitreoscilla sp.]|nr:hypothetical protein [Vitreoscilla sp.]
MSRPIDLCLFFVAAALSPFGAALAGEVHVAVAANFVGPLAKIQQGFTAGTGHKLNVSSGANGKS